MRSITCRYARSPQPNREMVAWNLVIILGLGFTGTVLARRLLARGEPVFAAVRGVERFGDLAAAGLRMVELPPADARPPVLPCGATILYSIPPLPPVETDALFGFVKGLEPARIVY